MFLNHFRDSRTLDSIRNLACLYLHNQFCFVKAKPVHACHDTMCILYYTIHVITTHAPEPLSSRDIWYSHEQQQTHILHILRILYSKCIYKLFMKCPAACGCNTGTFNSSFCILASHVLDVPLYACILLTEPITSGTSMAHYCTRLTIVST